jgi:heptosyltransferase-2
VPPPQAFMDVLAAVGVPPGPLAVELAATPAELAAADAAVAELFPSQSEPRHPAPLIVLNDNSASGTARAWGTEKLAALARWLGERLPQARILVHCGPADRDQARTVVALAAHPAVAGLHDIAELPIGLSKGIFARAALAVSSDSGPRHIAAAFGVPTVALVGPTDPRLGRSDPARCVEIRRDLACSPCGRTECPLGHHDCLRLVTVDEVGRAALDLLERFNDSAYRAG